MSIAEKFRLLSPLSVDREIQGVKVTFYTCSVGTCARLSGLLAEMAGHFTALLGSSSSRDQGSTEEVYAPPEGEKGEIFTKTIVQPINPDLAILRAKQREKSVQGAVTSLFSDKNRAAIGELFMDSLKDDFPRGKKRPVDECLAFVDEMDLPIFIEFFRGLAEANAKVFGDLGKELGRAVQDKAGELLGTTVVGVVSEEPEANAEEDHSTDG